MSNPTICIEGFPPIVLMNVLGWQLLLAGCTSDLLLFFIFCFQCLISDQKEPLVSLVVGFVCRSCVNLYPFWYQKLSHIRTRIVEKGCGDIQQKHFILWECIYFEKKTGIKLIYLLIHCNPILLIVLHLPECRDLICRSVGVVPPTYVSLRAFFTISSTSLA